MKNQIIKIVDYLYKKTGQKLTLKDKRWSSSIDSFIGILDKEFGLASVGENFLKDYFLFQFSYWINKRTRFDSTIMPNWLLGEKSFERWKNKNEHWSYFNSQFIERYRIVFDRSFLQFDTEDIEEIERKRFHNQNEGFAHCLSFASFNDCSLSCVTCIFKKNCRKIN